MKTVKHILCVLVLLLVIAVAAVVFLFGPNYKAASSVRKLAEGVYYYEYEGNDGFDKLLETGGASSAGEMAAYIAGFLTKGLAVSKEVETVPQDYGCATLKVVSPEGDVLMGRNFDWTQSLCIISRVKPKGGYEYVSAFDGRLLGFGDEWKPEGLPNQFMALSSMFFALDGINEKGLAIANLVAGDREETHQDSGKPDLTTTCALKYMLSRAADIDEAIALLKTVDMHSDVGWAHHYSMSDKSGRSVVVEYVDGEIVITQTGVVTNHYLCEQKYMVGKYPEDMRQEKLEEACNAAGGVMGEEELFNTMKFAWQSESADGSFQGTQWTEIFNLTKPAMTLCWNRDEKSVHRFDLTGSDKKK